MSRGVEAGEEAAWQANAKGLCEGPLCSLVLRVKIGKTLDLYAPGGSKDTGWGTLGPADIPLGSIGLPSTLAVTAVERTGDWSHSKAVVTMEGGAQLTLYANMLSPGIVVETSTDRLRLFAGQHERFVTHDDKGKMRIHGHMSGNPAPKGTITPAYVAVWPQRLDLRVCATAEPLPPPAADAPRALFWWGKGSHFVATGCPVVGTGVHQDAYLADWPIAVGFDESPASIAAAKEGGVDFAFRSPGRRTVIEPLGGTGPFAASSTQEWADKPLLLQRPEVQLPVPDGLRYPLSVRETFRYDAAKDEAVFAGQTNFLDVRKGARGLAAVPPLAMLARESTLKVKFPEKRWVGPATGFGLSAGILESDTANWSVEGLGRYAQAPSPGPEAGGPVAALVAQLEAQVATMLGAGRLAPWVYADNIPISAARGEYYWGEPGEALYLLAQLYPVVKKEQQAALLECMADIRKAFPPETTPLMPPDKGARRGGYDVGPCHVSKTIAEERGKRVSLFALYGLERYYALSGTKPTAEEWEACKKVIASAFEEQGWATLYHLGHPNRFLPWEGANPAEREQLRKEHGATASWRGDRPAAIVNANRRFSGAIGAIRLARLMGDKEAEQNAWWLFARAAVLRFAMGKIAQWRYQTGIVKLPPKPDWFWAWRGRGPQNWCGDLETMDWSKPEHDVQQVIELAPDRVELGHWAGVMGDKWHQLCTVEPVAFRYLTPELAAFLRDHLKAECAAYADRIAWNQPTWYASFAPAILGYEHNMNHPSDAFEHFMARAWILGEKPEQLERWIDVPWLERGDLFHLNKLAETIGAYRTAKP
ncbi:MAG: hypothetical protein FJ290_04890 [Planctomycetes bacterium]|nr:hypothetical protein [Planctomycetota bacterium]